MIEVPTFVKDKAGSVFLNSLGDTVKGGLLLPPSNLLPATVAANNGTFGPINLESDSDSWREILGLIASITSGAGADPVSRLVCIPKDYRVGERQLSNDFVPANHVFGTQLNPFYLDEGYGESILIPMQQLLTFFFMNPSSAGTALISFIAEATKIQNKARKNDPKLNSDMQEMYNRQTRVTPYWFVMDNKIKNVGSVGVPGVRINAGVNGVVVGFTNKQNATLILTSVMRTFITTGVAGETTEGFSFTLKDPTSDAPLSTNDVSSNCGAGTSAFPYRLPFPIFVGNRQCVEVNFNNLITDQATDCFLTFYGVAVWNDPVEVGSYFVDGYQQ